MTTFHGIKTPDGLGLFCVLEGAAPAGLPAEQFWPVNGEVPEGMTRTGWELIGGVVQPVLVPVPEPEDVVPSEVPTWALREVCAASTLRAPNLKLVIDAAIAGMAEPAKSIATGRWNSKPTIRRNDALTLQLIAGLGLTEAEADALFIAAANLN